MPADEEAILDLLTAALGWERDDRHRTLFGWKHRDGPFGPSPGWVAVDEAGVAGLRTFMRWRFRVDGEPVAVVRAVDTATHPRAQGRGVFRALTLAAVEELTTEGLAWVWNTPNGRSAPGYLSMGWQEMGRLGASFLPSGLSALPALARQRRPAGLWSEPTTAGFGAADVLADAGEVEELLLSCPFAARVQTERSAAYLRWRYGEGPVAYRAVLAGAAPRNGLVVFRVRRRGKALEAVIDEVLVPGGDRRLAARLCRRVLRSSGAHYVVTTGPRPPRWLPVPGGGPLLTWRSLASASAPPVGDWYLSSGDVELF